LISLTLLLPQIKTKNSRLFKSKKRIYEDEFFHVEDFKLNDNSDMRIFAPNQLREEGINHGYIRLKNVDHIASPYLKLMLSALYFQEIRKPKLILFIGLGIGVIPRALNFILKDTFHFDVVEIGRVVNFVFFLFE
jgi:hypothetical protein